MSQRPSWRVYPHWLVGALCLGVAGANLLRAAPLPVTVLAALLLLVAAVGEGGSRFPALALALVLAGWAWGSARLDRLDESLLIRYAGRAEPCAVTVTGPARRARFELRVPAEVTRFAALRVREPVLLKLPLGRSPPQGARLEVLAEVELPRGDEDGFDERKWLRRRGVHVILRADRWRAVGRRGGLWGVADGIRAGLLRSVGTGLHGERRDVIDGVVLGDDANLSEDLRDRFRASGLYHLLAVSGQNVALVAGGILLFAWLVGVPRLIAQLGALAGIGAYVLAVGPQPSVIRAGIAGALGSLAWLAARESDRWYFLLLGALALLAWNPYTLLDPGFQLSFAAVAAIFTLVPRIRQTLEGYPLPASLAGVVAISAACGLATAPIVWLQFHAVPLLAVPANALAAPAVVPLLGLAFAAAAVYPVSPAISACIAWLNGWCAAYLAGCARLVGGLPFAEVRSGAGAGALLAVGTVTAAYAWTRCRRT